MTLRKKLRYVYYRALRSHGKPKEVALGMAIGAVVALTPIFGHIPAAVALAALTGQSKLAAAVGVWLSNPLTVPFIYGACYVLGALVLGYPLHPPGGFLYAMTHMSSLASAVYVPLWVGCAVLALPLGAVTYWVTYQAVIAYRLKLRERRENQLHSWHWSPERGWYRHTAPEDAGGGAQADD